MALSDDDSFVYVMIFAVSVVLILITSNYEMVSGSIKAILSDTANFIITGETNGLGQYSSLIEKIHPLYSWSPDFFSGLFT